MLLRKFSIHILMNLVGHFVVIEHKNTIQIFLIRLV